MSPSAIVPRKQQFGVDSVPTTSEASRLAWSGSIPNASLAEDRRPVSTEDVGC